MVIRNDEDLRIAWDNVLMIKELQKILQPEAGEELLKNYKKSIREYYAKQISLPERRYFHCDSMDSYWCFGVTEYKSVEEAEEQHIPLTCYPDQLGRWFEITHKFFKRSDGKVCGYVCNAMNW